MQNVHIGQPTRYSGAPFGASNPVVIAVHGRGQDPGYVEEIFARLRWPEATCIAPRAAGGAWYPERFVAPIEENQPRLGHALESYDRWVRDLAAVGVGRDRLVLLGFSQGACLTAEYAVRHPARYRGIVVLTGGVIGSECGGPRAPGSFDGTPAFFGTSDVDEWVPLERVRESAALFRRLEAEVVERVYPGMGHTVSDAEVEDIRRALEIS